MKNDISLKINDKEFLPKLLRIMLPIAFQNLMLALTPVVTHCVKLTAGASAFLTGMMLINSFYMYGLAVPLAILGTFVFHWPVLVVYACTCIDEVGKIPWVLHHYKKYKWVQDLTR